MPTLCKRNKRFTKCACGSPLGRNLCRLYERDQGQEMTIPATCPDFVSHPHLVNGRGCYQCQTSQASEEQGTSAIAEALNKIGIPADVHQTGGFTMCVYVRTGEESYIYANAEGFQMYCSADCEGELYAEWGNTESTPEARAEGIRQTLTANDLKALPV